ncbi:Dihydroxy-acid dehydratase [Candidatus Portiera aleyrodidarum]|uniref:Dihydroxy-acid dehydratase n=1 Tax=Candidatus Portiera aleyrodidarum TV TaxID=1297582 RepID=A0A8D3X8U5_9GAMM|nr:dihydroxy-acid dehydratase [Candidatus Portiera aleyrodidarum]AGI27173.1 dihydroxy-acid dehydratase [Candidatus Portiera aleyrodidarum TV]CEI59151.1 Dihydroxy-acid dehydratase [Candidatus Portiera aleyrodidarum]
MKNYRSYITTNKNMVGARALWRATGIKDNDFDKPIIAIANSYTDFVPGHIKLDQVGKIIKKSIQHNGANAKIFNTIAIDDGIAMGHMGMLYSLPSRELIADSIEYMVNAHCADALVCISNCDKITPGMLLACFRLNLPTIFVSGGPMEAGRLKNDKKHINLVDAIIISGSNNNNKNKKKILEIEKNACPTCGSCSGMFTANSMNCLLEVLGLTYPGNGTLLSTHINRKLLFNKVGKRIVEITKEYYKKEKKVLPLDICVKESFENAMILDIAMGGSTNTILHLLAIAKEANINFELKNIDQLSRKVPQLCKLSPNTNQYYIEDFHRAGGVFGLLGELNKLNLLNLSVSTIHSKTLEKALYQWDIMYSNEKKVLKFYQSAPGRMITQKSIYQNNQWTLLDKDRKNGCIRNIKNCYSKDGGLAILFGNIAYKGCVVKTAGVYNNNLTFKGRAKVVYSQEKAVKKILNNQIKKGDVLIICFEGPKGGPGMQEMLFPTSYLKYKKLDKYCALLTDGRFSGGTSGLSIGHISPEAAEYGNIALIEDNDLISINIKERYINLLINKKLLSLRRKKMNNKYKNKWKNITKRNRKITKALKLYSYYATSADTGAIRNML